jgi:hypothetical protein
MTIFRECKRQCVAARSEPLEKDGDGCDLCCVSSGYICCVDSCPSTNEQRQPGWYKQRSLERTGLAASYEEEMGQKDGKNCPIQEEML